MPGAMSPETTHADVVVIGAGITGLVAALELLDNGRGVFLLDRCHPEEIGGLAREAFGGMFMVDTPEQRRSGVDDSYELALDDWLRIADFDDDDVWPRRWAEQYVSRARDDVGGWLRKQGVWFFPVVNWAERGMYGDGNSVPRFHLTWGCGQGLVDAVWEKLQKHPRGQDLEVRFNMRVTELVEEEGGIGGVRLEDGSEISANATVIAAGGIGGNLDIVRKEWPPNMGPPPEHILMGSHYYADGAMHEEVKRHGGNVTHIGRKMNELTGDQALDGELMQSEIRRYDDNLGRGKGQWNDDQIRRIAQYRNWRGDRLRTSKFQQIADSKAGPLIAIRLQVMARKSLGGIQTDLSSRVLTHDGEPIPGLYA